MADMLLQYFEVLEITGNYLLFQLIFIIISLLFLVILSFYRKFFILLSVEILAVMLFFYIAFTKDPSVQRPIDNSNYVLKATSGNYSVFQVRDFYNKKIGQKSSIIFFTSNMKLGIASNFKAKKLSETKEYLVLKIETGYNKVVLDTIHIGK